MKKKINYFYEDKQFNYLSDIPVLCIDLATHKTGLCYVWKNYLKLDVFVDDSKNNFYDLNYSLIRINYFMQFLKDWLKNNKTPKIIYVEYTLMFSQTSNLLLQSYNYACLIALQQTFKKATINIVHAKSWPKQLNIHNLKTKDFNNHKTYIKHLIQPFYDLNNLQNQDEIDALGIYLATKKDSL